MVVLRALALVAACVAVGATPPPAEPRWVLPSVDAPGVERRTFASAAVGGPVSFFVALPAEAADPAARFPVVYWLHGTGGGEDGVAAVSQVFRDAARDGRGPPVIVVFPNGLEHHLWSDAVDGRRPVETVLVRELVPHVDATLPTRARAEARWLEGFSMGGYGAARLGLRHPDVFGAVSALAGGPLDEAFDGQKARAAPALREAILRDVHGGDLTAFAAQSPLRLARTLGPATAGRTAWFVGAGDRDPGFDQSRSLAEALTAAGAAPTWAVAAGVGHEPAALLRALGDQRWAFYRAAAARIPAGTPPAP